VLISGPWQITIAIYLLYKQVKWAVFVGLAFQIIVLSPLQTVVTIKTRALQKKIQNMRDIRMKVINEVFGNMKIIKMYAWELSFGRKINGISVEELAILRCYIWWYTSLILFWGVCSYVGYT